MKRKRFTEEQITQILSEHQAGMSQMELSRKYNVSQKTISNWQQKYAGMASTDVRRLKQLEQENNRLKRIVADKELELTVAKDIINRFS